METHKRDFSQTSIPGNFIFYWYSELTKGWDSASAAEKAQTQACSPPLPMHVLNWRWTFVYGVHSDFIFFYPYVPLPFSSILLLFCCITCIPGATPNPLLKPNEVEISLKKKKKTSWKCWYPFSSVQSLSHVWLFVTPWTAATRLPCPSPIPRVYPNSCPLGRWSHPTISSSVIPFSSHLQSFPALGFFQMSQFFESDGQSIRVSASASVLPMNIQDWLPLGWTGLISLQPKGLSRVFSNTTVQKHQFFGAQLSL